MARLAVYLLVLPLALYMSGEAESASSPTDFIRASCRSTLYFDLCIQSLSGYAGSIRQNEQDLALTALSVSLAKAKAAQTFVTQMARVRGIKGREFQAVRDCIENMGDSVDRLSRSVGELGHMGRSQDFTWHMSNVQTWVSAALTDADTCLYGFSAMDGNVKAAIRLRIVSVAQCTSNGLAFVNRFATKHQGAAASEQP